MTDHRLNSRTVYMNRLSRFVYWNMNYHMEHHDLPAPNRSILAGFREVIPAFLRQLRYEDYFIERQLPTTAKPYREIVHHPDMLNHEGPRPVPVRP